MSILNRSKAMFLNTVHTSNEIIAIEWSNDRQLHRRDALVIVRHDATKRNQLLPPVGY